MLQASKTASFVGRAILNVLIVSTFALWVTEANAMASGGGNSGGGNSGGGNSGGGNSGGGNNSDGGGVGGGNNGGSDRGGVQIGSERGGYVTRNSADGYDIPVGMVISDDICSGGKYESC